MTNEEIGKRIEARRRELEYTLDYIAAKIGVAKSTIQRYEKGQIKKIKLPVIESIAGVLRVNPNWLIGNIEDPTPLTEREEYKNSPLINEDQELTEYLEVLKTRPEMRMLFQLSKDATKEDVEAAVRIIEALRNK